MGREKRRHSMHSVSRTIKTSTTLADQASRLSLTRQHQASQTASPRPPTATQDLLRNTLCAPPTNLPSTPSPIFQNEVLRSPHPRGPRPRQPHPRSQRASPPRRASDSDRHHVHRVHSSRLPPRHLPLRSRFNRDRQHGLYRWSPDLQRHQGLARRHQCCHRGHRLPCPAVHQLPARRCRPGRHQGDEEAPHQGGD